MAFSDVQAISSMIDLVNDQIESLRDYSRNLAEDYWRRWNELNEEFPNARGKIGVRVLYQKERCNLSIPWYRRQYSNIDDQYRVNHLYIPKGTRTDEYSEARIAKLARPWEVKLFREFEPEFAKVRRRCKHLSRVRKALKSTEKVIHNESIALSEAASG